jgi:hypothetical protein
MRLRQQEECIEWRLPVSVLIYELPLRIRWELELELIKTHITQKPVLRLEVGAVS